MVSILLTGMPRSGTTLITSILSAQENSVALAEPIVLSMDVSRHEAVEKIDEFLQQSRAAVLSNLPVPTKNVDGRIMDNFVEPPNAEGRLRSVVSLKGEIQFNKPLSGDFQLFVKHPAEFTALADLLREKYPLYAIVRDPVAVLAAWQTVNMPVNRGHMPMMECFVPELKALLGTIDTALERQVKLIEFQLATYRTFSPDRIIRYEDVVADPISALRGVCPNIANVPELTEFDPLERYPNVDFGQLVRALIPIIPLIKEFYPSFEQKWSAYLDPAGANEPMAAPLSMDIEEQRQDGLKPVLYVMGGYIPAGGTRMAYEIAFIAHKTLGLPVKIISMSGEGITDSVFDYPVKFDVVHFNELGQILRPHDLLICNPSFTNGNIGLSFECKKLMYVQGFNTYNLLDAWFDGYYSVSDFVRKFISNTYNIESKVIPPFIEVDANVAPAWKDRPAQSIWFFLKGDKTLQQLLLERLQLEIEKIDPDIARTIDWQDSVLWSGKIQQSEFLQKLGQRRHFVTLAVGEGFGLVPLEVMALGGTVLGFDGYGGLDYMRREENCLVRPYPDIRGVAEDVVRCLKNPDFAEALSVRGSSTARAYSKERFEMAWSDALRKFMQQDAEAEAQNLPQSDVSSPGQKEGQSFKKRLLQFFR